MPIDARLVGTVRFVVGRLKPTPPKPPKNESPVPTRRMVIAQIIVMVVLAPFVLMACYVDDWSRDLTTNRASTSSDAADERLRPFETSATPLQAANAVAEFANASDHWRVANERALPADAPIANEVGAPAESVHLVRTTGLMGYEDDVWLIVEALADDRIGLHAHSQSRVGKGDLGQNPRNLREMLDALRAALN